MSNSMLHRVLFCIATVSMLALTACNGVKPSQGHAQDLTLYDFSSAIRWGDFDKAYDFVDPKTKQEHPLSDIDRARYKQVEVAGYTVVSSLNGKDSIDQQVQLSLVNRNTQVGRSMVYHEHWRWDDAQKKWWLTSGLPDISPQE